MCSQLTSCIPKSRILRNKIGSNSSSSSKNTNGSTSSTPLSSISNYTGTNMAYSNNSIPYSLEMDNMRHAVGASIYPPLYPYACAPTTITSTGTSSIPSNLHGNQLMANNDQHCHHPHHYHQPSTNLIHSSISAAIKPSGWPSSHSVTDLLSSSNGSTFRSSSSPVSSPIALTSSTNTTTANTVFPQSSLSNDLNGICNTSPMAAAMAAAQNHYMHNYYMQAMIHNQAQSSATMPSIVTQHGFT